MKNRALIFSVGMALLLMVAPVFADSNMRSAPCRIPTPAAGDAAWTDYYGCMELQGQPMRRTRDINGENIERRIEEMREIRTFERN